MAKRMAGQKLGDRWECVRQPLTFDRTTRLVIDTDHLEQLGAFSVVDPVRWNGPGANPPSITKNDLPPLKGFGREPPDDFNSPGEESICGLRVVFSNVLIGVCQIVARLGRNDDSHRSEALPRISRTTSASGIPLPASSSSSPASTPASSASLSDEDSSIDSIAYRPGGSF